MRVYISGEYIECYYVINVSHELVFTVIIISLEVMIISLRSVKSNLTQEFSIEFLSVVGNKGLQNFDAYSIFFSFFSLKMTLVYRKHFSGEITCEVTSYLTFIVH